MKKIIPLIIISALSSTALHASFKKDLAIDDGSSKKQNSGVLEAKKMSFEVPFQAQGDVSLKKCTFHDKVEVTGDFEAKKSKFESDVAVRSDEVDLKESVFMGTFDARGEVEARDSEFKGLLTVHSSLVKLNKVSAESMIIDAPSGEDHDAPEVHLKKTKVSGGITFKGEAGVVYVDKKSKITGDVENGTILRD